MKSSLSNRKSFMQSVFSLCIVFILMGFSQITLYSKTAHVKAYPVPFNPSKGALTISDIDNFYSDTEVSISINIFDITGDRVFSRSYSSFPVLWKGYNVSGETVASGLYFIKISVEDHGSGEIHSKIIRILVKK